jgi:uncharacterized protein (TIGR02118 family)
MTKMVFVGRKRAGMTEDEFIMYWRQIHAPLVSANPGIRRYVIYPVIGFHSAVPVCDGLAEMWFDSRAMLEDGLASKEGRWMVADLTSFCSPESGAVVVDEIDVLDVSAETALSEQPADAREHGRTRAGLCADHKGVYVGCRPQ